MAHYAFLDNSNIVTEVIAGRDEWEIVDGISDWEEYYGNYRKQKCVRTSLHGNIRKRFAGIGSYYNEEVDIFIDPQPYPSWILDGNYDWQPPIQYPQDNKLYYWDENTLTWKQHFENQDLL